MTKPSFAQPKYKHFNFIENLNDWQEPDADVGDNLI